MSRIWTIAKREYRLYFNTPTAYVVAAMILFVLGLIFYAIINTASQPASQFIPGVQNVLSPLAFVLIFAVPAITMRTLSEETRAGTIELLLTAPVRDWEVVVGKWLGAVLFLLSILAITWIYPIIMNGMVDPGIDQGPMVSGYLGMALVIASFVAIGVTVSSFFSNQVASFILAMGLNLVLWWLIGIPAQWTDSFAISQFFQYLDFNSHFSNSMLRGVIALQDVVYYLSVTALFLLIGTVSLETRRWR